jgi:glycerophosphoryl diester phosphodiesterase
MTLVIAHRGAHAHRHAAGPRENTLEAFEAAIAAGADMIEFDVRRSADGQLVVVHDRAVGGRPINGLTHEELGHALGHRVALVREVVELACGRIGLDVELKEVGLAEDVLALLPPGATPEPLVVTSFLDGVVAEVKRRRPDVRTGLLLGVDRPPFPMLPTRLRELRPIPRARACGADLLAPHFRIAALGVLAQAAAAGLPCLVWTVNEERRMAELLADPRVEGVISDRPAAALASRAGQAPSHRPAA